MTHRYQPLDGISKRFSENVHLLYDIPVSLTNNAFIVKPKRHAPAIFSDLLHLPEPNASPTKTNCTYLNDDYINSEKPSS